MNANTKFLGIGAILIGIVVTYRGDPYADWVVTFVLVAGLTIAARATRG